MKTFALFLTLGLLAAACARSGGSDVNIKDGAFATGADGATAYTVYVNGNCSGIVVGSRHVLTAGHCLEENFRARRGGQFVNGKGNQYSYSFSQSLIHKEYPIAGDSFVNVNRNIALDCAGFGRDENGGRLKIAKSRPEWTVKGDRGQRLLESRYGNGSVCPGDLRGPAALNGRLVGIAIRSLDMGILRECIPRETPSATLVAYEDLF